MIPALTLSAFVASSALLAPAPDARPDGGPWVLPGDIALPEWAVSVAPRSSELLLFQHPGTAGGRRGLALRGTFLPLLGATRGPDCSGRWLLVGPSAWACGDNAELSPEEATTGAAGPSATAGLLYSYYIVPSGGANAYGAPDDPIDAPVEELEAGRVVAVTTERPRAGDLWGEMTGKLWVPLRGLTKVHASTFHGDAISDALDAAWVVSERAMVFPSPTASGKPARSLPRLSRVTVFEERVALRGAAMRISPDGEEPASWVHATDIAHATLSTPPDELGGVNATERWIDVELHSQTLVAYEGAKPVFATLVSTGRGAPGTDTATPVGVHRIWVKLITSKMAGGEHDESDDRFTLDDVPWVQFFERGVALHGAYWHHHWGSPVSHGCVNMAPIDAEWIFAFTSPHPPAAWRAVYPTPYEQGTVVRIRP